MSLAPSSATIYLVVSIGWMIRGCGSATLREEAGTLQIAGEERLAPSLDGALAEGTGSVPLLQPHIHTLRMENCNINNNNFIVEIWYMYSQ